MAKKKARYFTFLLYPESIPNDWQTGLDSLDIPIAVSPLHDKDVNTKAEEELRKVIESDSVDDSDKDEARKSLEDRVYKKPHYHVIYVAKNPVTADSVRDRIKRLLGNSSVAKVQIIKSTIADMYAYLTHESVSAREKKKYVYSKDDILHFGGFDVSRYQKLDIERKDEILIEVVDIIKENSIYNLIVLENKIEDLYSAGEIDFTLNEFRAVYSGRISFVRSYLDAVYQRKNELMIGG